MSAHIYAVVYGRSSEDIMFFTDINKARDKLLQQSKASTSNFKPFMHEYIEHEGVLYRTKLELTESVILDDNGMLMGS